MTTDDTENGWDALAEDLGVQSSASTDKPPPAAPARAPHRPASPHRDPRPEIEQEADDFGSGVTEDAGSGALYDPGPETVVDHAADIEETTDPLDEGLEGDEPAPREEGTQEEGGKRRRRRRRRKKKGGATDAAAEEEPAAGETEAGEEAATVEEGEAPAELEGDDEDATAPSAVDEELDAEASQPRPEWHVMSWAELVSKLYRPG
jgi:ribonuclease E